MGSVKFKRGQIWTWSDPIYGPKKESNEVAIAESAMRYDRFVLIIQTPNTMEPGGIVCAPLSSKNHGKNDIMVIMSDPESYRSYSPSYIKMNKIFPAHPRMLIDYVTTVDAQTMKAVEGEIIKMLLPSVTCSRMVPIDKFSAWYGIDLSGKKYKSDITHSEYTFNIDGIKRFIDMYIYRSNKEEDGLSIIELKRAYNTFCVINNIPIVNDTVEFTIHMSRMMGINAEWIIGNERKIEQVQINGIRFNELDFMPNGVTIIDQIVIPNPENKFHIIPDTTSDNSNDDKSTIKKRRTKWTDETISEFVRLYNDSPDKAIEQYGLKESSAGRYFSQWKKKYLVDPPISSTQDKAESEEIKLEPLSVPENKNIVVKAGELRSAISSFANGMRDDVFKKNNAWDNVYLPYEYEAGKFQSPVQWYNTLSSVIYNSLIRFFNIKDMSNGETINEAYLSEGSTMHFIISLYNGLGTSIGTIDKKIIKYRNKYHVDDVMSADCLSMLSNNLMTMINLNNEGSDIIYDMILRVLE